MAAAAALAFSGGEAGAEHYSKKHRHKPHPNPYYGEPGVYRYVRAESSYGSKVIIAPVRRARLGDQVRFPGGTWQYCEISCEYTLRKYDLDFWQSLDGSLPTGRFRKEFYLP